MNKSMWIGVAAGVGIAMASAVAGFSLLDKQAGDAPRVARAADPAKEECWDEQVAVVADPKDQHKIAGTAVGAVVGGAVGKDVGDRDLTTAAGAAVGALIGRKAQEEFQKSRADGRTVTTTERRCAPVGSR